MASAREAALVICLLAAVATLQGVQAAGCPDNCKDCDRKGVCTECKEGYGLRMFRNRAICKPCDDDHCKRCSKDYKHCDKCDNDYHFNRRGDCVKNRPSCPNNCKKCDRKGVCTECDNDYRLNRRGDCVKIITRCPDHCKNCDRKGDCTECMQGYGLRTGRRGKKCESCDDDNCKQCSGDYKHCDKCKDGYSFNRRRQKCVK